MIMRTYRTATTLALLLLSAVGASAATGPTAQLVSQSLTPSSLSIPGSGFSSAQTFLANLTVSAPVVAGEAVTLTQVIVSLYEDDVSFDDLIGQYVFSSGLPTLTATQSTQSFSLPITVSASALNSQCGGGCSSFFGSLAEGGGLEFYAQTTLQSTVTAISSVPEPDAGWMLASGVSLLALALRRQRGANSRANGHPEA